MRHGECAIYPVRPPVGYSVRPPAVYSVRPAVVYSAGAYRGYGARSPVISYGGVYLVDGHTVYVPQPSFPLPSRPVIVIDGQPYAVYSPPNWSPEDTQQRPVIATNDTPAQPDHSLRDATEVLGFGTAAIKFLMAVAELL